MPHDNNKMQRGIQPLLENDIKFYAYKKIAFVFILKSNSFQELIEPRRITLNDKFQWCAEEKLE